LKEANLKMNSEGEEYNLILLSRGAGKNGRGEKI
jgi:hypothetical protein